MSLAAVQRAVRRQPRGPCVTHLLLHFTNGDSARGLIQRLLSSRFAQMFGDGVGATVISLGFTCEGLRALRMPAGYLAALARNARAYAQGAAERAAETLGDSGASDAARWDAAFIRHRTHAVLTVHAPAGDDGFFQWLQRAHPGLVIEHLEGEDLRGPQGQEGTWMHFGYRDGLTHVPIKGLHPSRNGEVEHELGEVLLGHANDHGSNRWLLPQQPLALRDFFKDGSFGVLRVIEQDVDGFDVAVAQWAREVQATLKVQAALEAERSPALADAEAYIRAKLCGRWPEGGLFNADGETSAERTTQPFDHRTDPQGIACPLASHIRRMNPRQGLQAPGAQGVAHARTRVLLRRGTPYGKHGDAARGLLGWFFCADIEAQFEHLLGQWADRDPLGTHGASACKDPLAGQHEGDSVFTIPRRDRPALTLRDLPAFCRTRGTLYAFYPSSHALARMGQVDGYDIFERDGNAERGHGKVLKG